MDKLLAYLNRLTKDRRALFVAACGTSESYLRKAASTGQKIGCDLCIKIERASDREVMCEDLRPDCDWEFIRAGNRPGDVQPDSSPVAA